MKKNDKDKKVFKVDTWNHICIEGFCMVNTDYFSRSSKWVYGWKGNKDPKARGKLPNPHYDPNVKPNEKPDYCEGHVSIKCLRSGVMCPHLAFSKVEDDLRKKFKKMVHKHFESDKE
jgi:hypothetical protein